MEKITLAFDIYGTLIDTNGITIALSAYTQEPLRIAQTLRDKQLEYSFRRGLMRQYEDFSVCTRQALDYVDAFYELKFNSANKANIMQAYSQLPAYPEVADALKTLSSEGYRLFAFSNGSHATVEKLLRYAAIDQYFRQIISVEDVRSFKPDPAVYRYFLKKAHAQVENSWFISGNSFDLLGAQAVGFRSVRIQRTGAGIFNEWGIEPTLHITRLSELPAALHQIHA